MTTRRTKSVKVLRCPETFTAGLSSAVLEWLLIFLLFVNAVFSYMVTKFARFCELKIPCLLCSRLDRVLGNEKPGFYRDLLCGAHKLEISSLVICHSHDKLVDVHGMCEGCLSSFATKKRSNSETQKLLACKLGVDYDLRSLRKHPMLDPLMEKHCSCCNEVGKTRAHTHRTFPNKSIGSEGTDIGSRLPCLVEYSGLKKFDGLMKRRTRIREHRVDPLSHIGYSDLKITSRSESEVPISDDDDASGIVRETNSLKEEIVPHHVLSEPHTIAANTSRTASHESLASNKLTGQASPLVPSLLVPCERHDVGEPNHMTSSTSPISVEPDLEEFNWQQCEPEPQLPAPDRIAQHDDPSSPNAAEVVGEGCKRSFDMTGSGDLVGTSKNERGDVCKLETDFTPATVRGAEKDQVVELSGETCDVSQTIDVEQLSSDECCAASNSDSVLNVMKAPGVKRDQGSNIPGPSLFNLADHADLYKLAIENKGDRASSILSEKHTIKDSAKVNENLKLLPKRISAQDSVNYTSPRVHENHEELMISDGASSVGLDRFQNEIYIERNESGFESLDGSIFSEHEGENMVDLMNCQVLYDRKCLSALYKELDEERNASAIAANETMAMITRLQEEKAALNMEASQYLRMMEEQAEYDMQAIQHANDLLAEKEKEIQDLEAELDYYRIKYPEDEMKESIPERCDDKVPNMTVKHSDLSSTLNNTNGVCDPWSIKTSKDINKSNKTDAIPGDNQMSIIKDSLLSFEYERLIISQCLKKLEKKLNLGSDDEVHMNMCNGVCPGKDGRLNNMEHDLHIQERNQIDEDGSPMQMDSHSPVQERSSFSDSDSLSVIQRNHYFDGHNASITSTTTDLVSIESEVLNLNERLEILEAEKDFLEHTINSLLYGNEGIQFIQEIAHHLEELRRIGIRKREKDVA